MPTATITKGKNITSFKKAQEEAEAQEKASTRAMHTASPKYRDNLSRWLNRLQKADAFNKRDRSFGEYIESFLDYYEQSTGKKTNARDGNKNGYAYRWKRAATNPNFQKLDQDSSWEIKFIEFCITGELDSNFNVTEFFDNSDVALLPLSAWRLKNIPQSVSQTIAKDSLSQQIARMELQLAQLEKKNTLSQQRITQLEKTIKMTQGLEKTSFSQLLEDWVKLEAQRSQLPIEIIIDHLTNRLGGAASSTEIKDIIYGTYPIAEARLKHYAMWVASLGILTDATGRAYTGKELIAMLPTKTTN
jgi:hypothetical protein